MAPLSGSFHENSFRDGSQGLPKISFSFGSPSVVLRDPTSVVGYIQEPYPLALYLGPIPHCPTSAQVQCLSCCRSTLCDSAWVIGRTEKTAHTLSFLPPSGKPAAVPQEAFPLTVVPNYHLLKNSRPSSSQTSSPQTL